MEFGDLIRVGAGDERCKIIERTTRGRNRKAKEGKVIGSGNAPYGYTYAPQKDNFAINETEAAIVRQIYQWYVFGEDENPPLTYIAIARRLWLWALRRRVKLAAERPVFVSRACGHFVLCVKF